MAKVHCLESGMTGEGAHIIIFFSGEKNEK